MARVTISLGIPPQAKAFATPLFDRILAILSFSSRLNAAPPGGIEDLVISIELGGNEIARKTFMDGSAEWQSDSASFEIASGGPYRFVILGRGGDLNEDSIPDRVYGGIGTLESVAAGDEVSLSIQMGDLPVPDSDFWFNNVIRTTNQQGTPLNLIQVSYEGVFTGYILYRATNSDSAPYSRIATFSYESSSYEDFAINASNTYYYKVSAYNAFGEGDMTYYIPDNN